LNFKIKTVDFHSQRAVHSNRPLAMKELGDFAKLLAFNLFLLLFCKNGKCSFFPKITTVNRCDNEFFTSLQYL